MTERTVSLQVNVAPSDVPHLALTLPHQLRQLGPQFDHVVITVDARSPTAHREAPAGAVADLRALLAEIAGANSRIVTHDLSYSEDEVHSVRDAFRMSALPLRDYAGAPFYGYLAGLARAPTDLVMHLDADMLIGGSSPDWVSTAVRHIDAEPDLLICAPLSGPPAPELTLPADVLHAAEHAQHYGSAPTPLRDEAGYEFTHVSTRCFLTSKRRLAAASLRVLPLKVGWMDRGRMSGAVLPLEVSISEAMHRSGLRRWDFLGPSPGLWVVHPAFRGREYLAELPRLIAEFERGEVRDPHMRGRPDLMTGDAPSLPMDSRPLWRRIVSRELRRTPLRRHLLKRARRLRDLDR
jgi:hypothetical protein